MDGTKKENTGIVERFRVLVASYAGATRKSMDSERITAIYGFLGKMLELELYRSYSDAALVAAGGVLSEMRWFDERFPRNLKDVAGLDRFEVRLATIRIAAEWLCADLGYKNEELSVRQLCEIMDPPFPRLENLRLDDGLTVVITSLSGSEHTQVFRPPIMSGADELIIQAIAAHFEYGCYAATAPIRGESFIRSLGVLMVYPDKKEVKLQLVLSMHRVRELLNP